MAPMMAVAWTLVIILVHGNEVALDPEPVENPLGCFKKAEETLAKWSLGHPGAAFTVRRLGCTRHPEYPS